MAHSDKYENLFAQVAKGASRKSENFEKLSQAEQQDVLGFVKWLQAKGWKQSVVASYKSYVVCVLAGLELTNDRKSGMRKFKEYLDERDSK